MALRALKKYILESLRAEDFHNRSNGLLAMPARKVVNPLFGLLYSGQELVRWRAVTTLGAVTANLADHDIESARVIMRRLMWNLNDESGGIGWGSPEAMGAAMAGSRRLAEEYAWFLIASINPDGNYLEHPGLQGGTLWGLGRLARVHPDPARPALPFIPTFFNAEQADLRGLAVWAAAPIADAAVRSMLEPLCNDQSIFTLFENNSLCVHSVAEMAGQALLRDRTPQPK